MKFRSIFPLMLLALQSALHGQDGGDAMRKGEDALAAGLWEMAALHFNDRLSDKNLAPAEKSRAAIRLAEAWVREGRPAEALELLEQSFVGQDAEARFWKGQAMAALGQLAAAADVFALLMQNAESPHRHECGLTLANLELALGKSEAALATLGSLADVSDPAVSTRIRLQQVEILFDLGRFEEARKMMPAAAGIGPKERAFTTFLEAHLLLKEGKAADAASGFQTLVDEPKGQSLQRHNAAVLGLADALLAEGKTDAATDALLSFIQDHPDSPQLEAMFRRLQDSLPETPALTDPILERLAQWIPPAVVPATGLLATEDSSAIAAWPSSGTTSDLTACSLFTRAFGLQRIQTPEALAEANRLFTRLRIERPDHILTSRALYEKARRSLADGEVDRAFGMLDALRENAPSPALRGSSAFLEARSAHARGDKKQAIRLFEEAAASLTDKEAQTARLNAAIIRLTDESAIKPVLQTDAATDKPLASDLEIERALAAKTPAAVRAGIEEFLIHHPDHERVPEARLAAAEAALASANPDLSFARAQLDTLAAEPAKNGAANPSRMALIQLRIEDLSKNSAAAIAAAKTIIEKFPGDPASAEAALILGRNLFQTRSYNDARLVLEKLAVSDTDPARAQAAWLLAARSAALVPTSQSQQEALILYDKVIESKSSVSPIAKLEKARLMIDMNRLPDATAFLRKWFDSLPDADPLHLPAGLLLGEAIYAQGGMNPGSLAEALAVYDKLLAHAEDQPAVFNRLQYLRGRTLEQIPEEKDTARKRDRQAFIAYYSVLETSSQPAEWHYFELCGFRALALLEKAGRWPAAIACAKKIASFKGPRAEEAATRASQLQLKHQIWED